MSINNVKVRLDGRDLQVDTNGVQPHRITVVDYYQPWLSREQLASERAADDSVGFDVTMLSGKRVRVRYGPSAPTAIPVNNDAAIDSLYRKLKKYGYDVTGTGMSQTDALHFYGLYNAAQTVWLQRAKLLAQLADPDISIDKRTALATQLNAAVVPTVQLAMNGATYNVSFDEGQSCQFTSWVITEHVDFKFSLVAQEYI